MSMKGVNVGKETNDELLKCNVNNLMNENTKTFKLSIDFVVVIACLY